MKKKVKKVSKKATVKKVQKKSSVKKVKKVKKVLSVPEVKITKSDIDNSPFIAGSTASEDSRPVLPSCMLR